MNSHRLLRGFYFTGVGIGALFMIYAISKLGLLLITGFLTAFLLNPLIKYFERKGYNRGKATFATLGTLLLLLLTCLLVFYPIVREQYEYIHSNQTLFETALSGRVDAFHQFLAQYLPSHQVTQIDASLRSTLQESYVELQEKLPSMLGSALGILGQLIFFPVVAFFFIMEGENLKKKIIERVPNRYFEMVLMVFYQINLRLGGYLRGQFMDCLIIGILASIGLSLLNIKGAVLIGLFAGAANAIPYLGPVVGAIPALFMLLIDPEAKFPWYSIPLVFLLINLLDNIFVYPLTVGKSLNLHPMVVILGILFGGSAAGLVGMIVIVPAFAILWHSFMEVHKTLHAYKILR